MATRNRKDRIVVFRLTESDYASLTTACRRAGARNLSDFARSVLMVAVEGQALARNESCPGNLRAVLGEIGTAAQRIKRLLEIAGDVSA